MKVLLAPSLGMLEGELAFVKEVIEETQISDGWGKGITVPKSCSRSYNPAVNGFELMESTETI